VKVEVTAAAPAVPTKAMGVAMRAARGGHYEGEDGDDEWG